MPYAKRTCGACMKVFTPPRSSGDRKNAYSRLPEALQRLCPECRGLQGTEQENAAAFSRFQFGSPLPKKQILSLNPPLKQAVFDLETWGLDRGWGVTLLGVILVHGDGPDPKWYEFSLTDSSKWPTIRSDDSEVVANILKVLSGCHIAYAHNGKDFDFKWLRSVALRYGMPSFDMKLVDPVQIARNRFRIGSNSLSSLADFLGLEEKKMPLPADVWRSALLDADPAAWELLKERCRSDVRLLNEVAGRVTGDAGLIDKDGSGWRR